MYDPNPRRRPTRFLLDGVAAAVARLAFAGSAVANGRCADRIGDSGAKGKQLKRLGRLAAAATLLALVLVPSASSYGQYGDALGDSGSAGDIAAVTAAIDKSTGNVVFTITGINLIGSDLGTAIVIDSDVNPSTGDPDWLGADYLLGLAQDGYSFGHWTGSQWDWNIPYSTVHILGNDRHLVFTVNRSELGNVSEFNFLVEADNFAQHQYDDAPDDGFFNYSADADGVHILGATVQTTPAAPKAGKQFTLTPTGLKLPPDGRETPLVPQPDSYTCKAMLKGKALAGSGTGGCTWKLPKRSKGKTLNVVLTVSYEGTTTSFPYAFKVR